MPVGEGTGGSNAELKPTGNAYLLTSYDAASSGLIVNQVQRAYNGLGQLTTEWQAHGGAVNTSTSPKVQYALQHSGQQQPQPLDEHFLSKPIVLARVLLMK